MLATAAIVVISGFAIYKPTQLHPLPLLFGAKLPPSAAGLARVCAWIGVGGLALKLLPGLDQGNLSPIE